jgi:hypothetical protein
MPPAHAARGTEMQQGQDHLILALRFGFEGL